MHNKEIVNGLLKTGTPEQKEAAKTVFTATLKYLLNAKATNEYFDANLSSGVPKPNRLL